MKKVNIGKYGHLRLTYLKEHRRGLWTELLMKGTLTEHLKEIDDTANARVETIIKELAKADNTPIYYDGKMEQLEWVGKMNGYKNQAEEIIYNELIYN